MDQEDAVPYVPHEEFRAGLPAGRIRVVVDPKLARRYVSQRLMLLVLLMPLIGAGIALALVGRTWLGAGLVAAGVVLNRVVMAQAPRSWCRWRRGMRRCTTSSRRTACWKCGGPETGRRHPWSHASP